MINTRVTLVYRSEVSKIQSSPLHLLQLIIQKKTVHLISLNIINHNIHINTFKQNGRTLKFRKKIKFSNQCSATIKNLQLFFKLIASHASLTKK